MEFMVELNILTKWEYTNLIFGISNQKAYEQKLFQLNISRHTVNMENIKDNEQQFIGLTQQIIEGDQLNNNVII